MDYNVLARAWALLKKSNFIETINGIEKPIGRAFIGHFMAIAHREIKKALFDQTPLGRSFRGKKCPKISEKEAMILSFPRRERDAKIQKICLEVALKNVKEQLKAPDLFADDFQPFEPFSEEWLKKAKGLCYWAISEKISGFGKAGDRRKIGKDEKILSQKENGDFFLETLKKGSYTPFFTPDDIKKAGIAPATIKAIFQKEGVDDVFSQACLDMIKIRENKGMEEYLHLSDIGNSNPKVRYKAFGNLRGYFWAAFVAHIVYVTAKKRGCGKAPTSVDGVQLIGRCGLEEQAAIDYADLIARVALTLDEKDKKILALRGDGVTLREIGEKVGMSKQAVDKRLGKLRKVFTLDSEGDLKAKKKVQWLDLEKGATTIKEKDGEEFYCHQIPVGEPVYIEEQKPVPYSSLSMVCGP